jgi:hypothetical protein
MSRAATSTKEAQPEKVYYCSVCGYGYANEALAKECEAYCTTNNSCSLKITANAIRTPKESENSELTRSMTQGD